MPMPVSVTENAMTVDARFRVSFCGLQPDLAVSIANVTCPSCVNLKEFDVEARRLVEVAGQEHGVARVEQPTHRLHRPLEGGRADLVLGLDHDAGGWPFASARGPHST